MSLARRRRLSVASRIHLSFILAAALPLFLLAATAYHMVSTRLEQVALDEARELAKSMGMDVFERLQFMTDQMTLLVDGDRSHQAIETGLGNLNLGERTLGFFHVSASGEVLDKVDLDADERAAFRQVLSGMDSNKPLLLATGAEARQRLFMLVRDKGHDVTVYFASELSLTHLWDTAGVAARPERVCVLDQLGEPVFCNFGVHRAWIENTRTLVSARGSPRPVDVDGDERLLTAVWSLFLKPYYQFERWTVMVGIPESMAFASIRTFDRVFGGVAVVALLLALLFGRRMIRSNLEPLHRLNDATAYLAGGDFSHRVELHSGDEFERLGDAFDGMAAHIGAQFDEMETLARLDRELQLAPDFAAAAAAASRAMADVFAGDRVAVLCHERWETPGRLQCHGFDNGDIAICEPPGGSFPRAPLAPTLIEGLNGGSGAELSVFPVVDSALVAACIVLRGEVGESAGKRVGRVADVLGISLTNLAMERRLSHQAHHDWLTDLPNRTYLRKLFDNAATDTMAGDLVGLMLIGIDRFKQINDTLGHAAGDQLLAQAAQRLQSALPHGAVLSRFAGDQFVLMLVSDDQAQLQYDLTQLATRVADELDRPLAVGARDMRLSATMGAALYPRDAESFEGILQCLDAASYAAKDARRGGMLFFNADMRERLAGRLDVEQALKGAVSNNEMVLHYQPVVDAQTGQVRSAEALMRWQRPDVGLVMPGGFIEIAEQSGLIAELGNWAIGEACRQMKAWQQAGLNIDTLNVNVSSAQLANDDVFHQVKRALAQTGIDPQGLTLEVTETALIGRFDEGVERLKRLRALGVRIMIDDFGTGYASLKYLKMLPVDGLKIDRLFVKDLPDSPADEAIVAAVVSLARASDFKLVGEGIETEAQAAVLREAGVPLLQGFLFARALPAEQFPGFVRKQGEQWQDSAAVN